MFNVQYFSIAVEEKCLHCFMLLSENGVLLMLILVFGFGTV